MATRLWLILNLIVLALAPRPTIAQNKERQNQGPAVKAFPSAEGFGAQSQGGRGGRVIEVTNLNDSGPGSLRSCLEASGPRICVFRVSGTITLNSAIRVSSPYLTVAGQTSPGGVQIKGNQKPQGDWGIWFVNGAHDIIVRHLRVRMGGNMQHDAGNNILCYGTAETGVHDVIVDHCSVCWGSDTQLDWYGSYLDRATFQWNIIAEADMGSHIGGNRAPKNITLHHNLYANLGSRTPLMQHADVFDFRNNVIYNWNGNNSAVFGQFALNSSAFGNVVDNLWLAGPESGYPYLNVGNGGPIRIDGSAADDGGTRLYISGNWGPRCPKGCANDWIGHGVNTWDYYELNKDGSTHLVDQAQYDAEKPFPAPLVALDPVSGLLDRMLPAVGAHKPSRDGIDRRIVKSVRDKTGTYRVNTNGPWPDLATGAPTPPPDSDHDGMPDAWEEAHGLDPNNDRDGAACAANGYTNVENYLNELAGYRIPGSGRVGESGEYPGVVVFYVSPQENDTWSGRVATPRKTDGPFATILRAQQAVRNIRKTHAQAAVRVTLRDGTYYLDSPLEFGPEDSGAVNAPVVYAAATRKKVVLSGGRRLKGGRWGAVNGRKAWVADIPEVKEGQWRFRQLFVNGARRPRTRLPKQGEYRIESLPGYTGDFLRSPTKRFVYAYGMGTPGRIPLVASGRNRRAGRASIRVRRTMCRNRRRHRTYRQLRRRGRRGLLRHRDRAQPDHGYWRSLPCSPTNSRPMLVSARSLSSSSGRLGFIPPSYQCRFSGGKSPRAPHFQLTVLASLWHSGEVNR